MSFYVRRSPGPCDPRSPAMGHRFLNGIQTPPARIWFEDRGPATPTSKWTYHGPLGASIALPEMFASFITGACAVRQVIWILDTTFPGDVGPVVFQILIAKVPPSAPGPVFWDSYGIQLKINGVASDTFIEHLQLSEFDYSRYQNINPGTPWTWGAPNPFQVVTWTEAWPIAWDRTLPGPPFVPGL